MVPLQLASSNLALGVDLRLTGKPPPGRLLNFRKLPFVHWWNFSGKTAGVLVKIAGGSGPLAVPSPPWKGGITGCSRGCGESLATGAGRRKRTVLGMEAPCFWMSPWYPPRSLAKESVYRAQLQCHRAGQTTGLGAEKLNQEQSSPIFKCLVSVLAVCVFQGISTFCISRLVA